ncbi:Poly polymerase [Peniophora sp. CONT]|nr:Poly polymerase [Peniophora sp. CONT]
MYGKGIYLADIVSKSAQYCHTHLSNRYGLLLLCEAAVKPTFEQLNANSNAAEDCKKAGKMATHGLGRWQPSEWQDAGSALGNDSLLGVHMPKGPAKERTDKQYGLYYNEYITYNVSQVKLRYMLLFKT